MIMCDECGITRDADGKLGYKLITILLALSALCGVWFDTMYVMNDIPHQPNGGTNMNPDDLAYDLFIAEGGVDDFDDLTESEIRVIVLRELTNHLAELVVASAINLQGRRREENNV
jgi:hypothetical protein